MTYTYISPKLMEELKDGAVQVFGGPMLWYDEFHQRWIWFRNDIPAPEPFTIPSVDVSPAVDEQPLDAAFDAMTAPRVSGPIVPDPAPFPVERGGVHIPPPPAVVEELARIAREKEDGERLKVLGRLFERLFRGGGLILAPTTGQVVWWICPAQSYDEMLSAEELEAVRGIG